MGAGVGAGVGGAGVVGTGVGAGVGAGVGGSVMPSGRVQKRGSLHVVPQNELRRTHSVKLYADKPIGAQ